MSDVFLKISDQIYGGWHDVKVDRGIPELAASFDISLTNKWGRSRQRPEIRDGDPCAVYIDEDLVITGYVNEALPSYEAESSTLAITGRSSAGDLVDCAAGVKQTEWKDRNLLQICRDVCKPFNIAVFSDTTIGENFKKVDVAQGETAADFIHRLCAARAVFPISDAFGNIRLARAGTELQGALVRGKNILRGSGTKSSRERFSEIIVKGTSQGNIWKSPAATASSQGRATDPNVRRYRPKIIIADEDGGAGDFQTRAQFEVNVRAGRAKSFEYWVKGWRTEGDTGPLWAANKLVTVIDPENYLNTSMLVDNVSFSKSENGEIATLSVTLPGAYDLLPIPLEGATTGW